MAKKPNKRPSNSAASASQRERLRLQQEKEARERKVRNGILIGVVGVLALALVGTLTWVIVAAMNSRSTTAADAAAPPGTYVLTVGEASAPVTVDVYSDFMCPFCGQFERAQSEDIESLVKEGTIQLKLHPMAFLDQQSNGQKFSTRAANALVTVAMNEPDKTLAFNAILFENQPEEGTSGLSDTELIELAKQVGVTPETAELFKQQQYADWVAKATEAAFAEGITGTPTVKINGTKFEGDIYTPGTLRVEVERLAAQQQ
jgi:protein-disulfide isomerase